MVKKRLLLIDDDSTQRRLLSLFLRNKGYEVFSASNGVEGVSEVKKKNPDLVIIDHIMPDLDGKTAIPSIKAYKNMPIILLSSCLLESDDMCFFYPKPLKAQNLVAVIENLLYR